MQLIPIIPLILGIFLTIIVVRDSLIKKSFLKYRLIFCFIFLFVVAILYLFIDNICTNDTNTLIYTYIMIALSVIPCVMFLFNGLFNISQNELNNKVLASLDNNINYLFINKKGNIIALSNNLKNELKLDEEVTNIKELLNDYITIDTINDDKVTNKEFLSYLNIKQKQEETNNLDIRLYLSDGTIKRLNLIEEVIFIKNRYFGRLFTTLNKEVVISGDNLSGQRELALINTSTNGLVLVNIAKGELYLNDYLADILGLDNNLNYSDYLALIEANDRVTLEDTIKALNKDNNTYEAVYKIKSFYFKEKGEVIFDGKEAIEIVSQVVISNTKNFMRTNTILDNLEEENNLIVKLNELSNNNINYEVVYFRMLNIPEINEQFSRQIGTMAIEEYVKNFKQIFADYIYRISGLDFCFIICDIQKMELFKKTLTKNKIFSPSLNYGSVVCNVEVRMGISYFNDSIYPKDIYLNAKKALTAAISNGENYMFYKEIGK